MNINLLPFAAGWAALALVVIGMIVYRKRVANQEDDTIHVMDGDARLVPKQAAIAQKLESIDRWGKLLTIIAAVTGLAIGLSWAYQSWLQTATYMGR